MIKEPMSQEEYLKEITEGAVSRFPGKYLLDENALTSFSKNLSTVLLGAMPKEQADNLLKVVDEFCFKKIRDNKLGELLAAYIKNSIENSVASFYNNTYERYRREEEQQAEKLRRLLTGQKDVESNITYKQAHLERLGEQVKEMEEKGRRNKWF